MGKKSKQPNIDAIQALLDQLSYDDFIAMLAIMADKHPLGAIRQIQALDGGKHSVIFVKTYSSLEAALQVVQGIEDVS